MMIQGLFAPFVLIVSRMTRLKLDSLRREVPAHPAYDLDPAFDYHLFRTVNNELVNSHSGMRMMSKIDKWVRCKIDASIGLVFC